LLGYNTKNMEKIRKAARLIWKRKLLILLLFAMGIGAIWYSQRNKNISLETVKAERKDLTRTLISPGKIAADTQAVLQFQTSGRLVWVGVKQGDRVEKFQAIASLDKQELQKQLQKELNDYLINRWDFEQTSDDIGYWDHWFELSDEARRSLETSQFNVDNSVIAVELANIALKNSTLYSPISGIVVEADSPLAGVNITPSQARFVVIDPGSIYFSLEVDEEDVADINLGMPVEIDLDAFTDSKQGVVSHVSFVPVAATGSPKYEVKVSLNEGNSDLKFKLGMEGDGEVVLEKKTNVLSLPVESLHGTKKAWVYVLENGQKVRKDIEIGLETEDRVEILSGLNEGDEVVIE
jgi:RND family efflux transporter MFP subunit